MTATAFALCAASAVAQDLSLDEIVANHYEALGGLDQLKSVTTRQMTGVMSLPQGMEATFLLISKRPTKARMEFTLQGLTAVQAYDGETAWMVMPFMGQTEPEVMPPDLAEPMSEEADFDGPLVDYQEKGHQLELAGMEEVEGADTYKLKLTLTNGEVTYYFLDAEYFLPIKTTSQRTIQGADLDIATTLSDYKEVDGMMIPHSIAITGQGPGTQTLTINVIEHNVAIDDERFMMPKTEAVTDTTK
jgi:outer membrane lipoprotein-sorting protein